MLPSIGLLALTLSLASMAPAQDGRPVAFVNARILTMAGKPIETGTVLVRDGVIADVGKAGEVDIPAGTRVIDASGHTLMPGLVSAWSRAGLTGTPRSGPNIRVTRGFRGFRSGGSSSSRSASNKAAQKAAAGLYARQEVFGQLMREGVTTLGLVPNGSGFPGQGAVLNPAGKTNGELVQDDEAFVVVGMSRSSSTKKILKESFEKAAKVVEARKKPKEEPKKPDAKDAAKKPDSKKDGEKPKEGDKKTPPEKKPPEKKPEPKKQDPKAAAKPAASSRSRKPRKDPNVEVLADLLEGKRRGFVTISSAADMMHYKDAVDEKVSFPATVIATRPDPNSGHLDLILDDLKKMKAAVLMPPRLSTVPPTQALKNIAADLDKAGIDVGFVISDNRNEVRGLMFQLMELVRHGLPADAALKGVTAIPAKALGLAKEVGTIEEGKKANLLVFSGDPLDPLSTLKSVWLEGREVRGAGEKENN